MFVFRILNGGENKYPASSFVLNCKGAHINLNIHGPWMVICLFIDFGAMTPSKTKTEEYTSQSRAKQFLLLSGIFVGKSYHEGLARLSTQTFYSLRNGKLDWFQYNTCKKFVFVTITTLNF